MEEGEKLFDSKLSYMYIHFIIYIYIYIYIYFSQHNYIITAQVKATCFDLKSHRQAKNHEVLYNVAVRIWDPRLLTMCAVIRTMYIT